MTLPFATRAPLRAGACVGACAAASAADVSRNSRRFKSLVMVASAGVSSWKLLEGFGNTRAFATVAGPHLEDLLDEKVALPAVDAARVPGYAAQPDEQRLNRTRGHRPVPVEQCRVLHDHRVLRIVARDHRPGTVQRDVDPADLGRPMTRDESR